MTLAVRYGASASAELAAAAQWYEDKAPGAGDRFLDAEEEARSGLARWPRSGQPVEDPLGREMRRVRVRDFPYQLIYVVTDEEVLIVAVTHYRRRPGYWADRTT